MEGHIEKAAGGCKGENAIRDLARGARNWRKRPIGTGALVAQAAGAVACLSKDRDAGALTAALETLYNGGVVFDNGLRSHPAQPPFSLRGAKSCRWRPRGCWTSRSATGWASAKAR